MTGAADRTWDLQLATDASFVDGEAVNLVFGSSDEAGLGETVFIAVEGETFSISTTGGSAYVVGRTGEGCTHMMMPETDIVGSFECTQLTAISGDEVVIGPVDISGSFQADR